MRQLAPISKGLHFKIVIFILIGQLLHVLLTKENSLTYSQKDCFAFLFET